MGGNNLWDNGTVGNYWGDYLSKYPNASEIGNSGIGDTPYIINSDNIDYYPLMAPFEVPPAPTPSPEPQPEPFPTTLVIASVITVAVFGIGLLAYLKKRKR